jgi:hypothetical protein
VRGWKLKVRGIDDPGNQGAAAGDSDGLGAMLGFAAASPPGGPSLRATEIFGPRKFVAAVVDHVVAGKPGRHEGS